MEEGQRVSLANILVHVDSSPRAAERVALAVRLAERERGRLTGVFAETADPFQVGVVTVWPSERYTAAMERAHAAFQQATAALGERASFMDANRGSGAAIFERLTDLARSFDLVVVGQTEEGVPVPAKLPERLITQSGRPVLVVPFVGTYPDIGHRPLFAWRRSAAAARALADSRLIVVARPCDGLVMEVLKPSEEADEFASLVIAGLAAHGVTARFEHVVVDDVDVMDTLLNAAADHSSDLLVIGGFDAGGLALLGRGAGSRFILAHMTLPVLFSH
jgi:nucleotide-binding universal stress UspA family protein